MSLVVLVNDYNVWSSVFNHMVCVDIHVPEDLHTLCLYDRFTRMLVPVFRTIYVICFTETPVDSYGDFVVSFFVL